MEPVGVALVVIAVWGLVVSHVVVLQRRSLSEQASLRRRLLGELGAVFGSDAGDRHVVRSERSVARATWAGALRGSLGQGAAFRRGESVETHSFEADRGEVRLRASLVLEPRVNDLPRLVCRLEAKVLAPTAPTFSLIDTGFGTKGLPTLGAGPLFDRRYSLRSGGAERVLAFVDEASREALLSLREATLDSDGTALALSVPVSAEDTVDRQAIEVAVGVIAGLATRGKWPLPRVVAWPHGTYEPPSGPYASRTPPRGRLEIGAGTLLVEPAALPGARGLRCRLHGPPSGRTLEVRAERGDLVIQGGGPLPRGLGEALAALGDASFKAPARPVRDDDESAVAELVFAPDPDALLSALEAASRVFDAWRGHGAELGAYR